MKAIIQIDENGNVVNFPVHLQNFIQAFPDLDVSGDEPPKGWAWFTYISADPFKANNEIKPTQTFDFNYVLNEDGSGFQTNHFIRDLTSDEFNQLVKRIKDSPPFGFNSWTLETDTYFWIPPTERPKGRYRWDEPTGVWVACTSDTGTYTDIPFPEKWPSKLTPKDALPKPPVANTSNTITANI